MPDRIGPVKLRLCRELLAEGRTPRWLGLITGLSEGAVRERLGALRSRGVVAETPVRRRWRLTSGGRQLVAAAARSGRIPFGGPAPRATRRRADNDNDEGGSR